MSKQKIMDKYWLEYLQWLKKARFSGSTDVEKMIGRFNVTQSDRLPKFKLELYFWFWYMNFKISPRMKSHKDKA